MDQALERLHDRQQESILYVRNSMREWAAKRTFKYESVIQFEHLRHVLLDIYNENVSLRELVEIASEGDIASSRKAQKIIKDLDLAGDTNNE